MPFASMLATPGTVDDVAGDGWALEMKWDGVRAMAAVDRGRVRLWSRSGADISDVFPDVAEALREAGVPPMVLDGEIVALDARGRPSFETLQGRLGRHGRDAARAAARVPTHLFAFDVLRIGGEDAIRRPYLDRRALLTDAATDSVGVAVPATFAGGVRAAMEFSRAHGLEGVVAKRADGPYRPGARSRDWIKVKHRYDQEVVVVGWQEGGGRRAGLVGSILLADSDLPELTVRLRALERPEPSVAGVPSAIAGAARWVEPVEVAEVSSSGWTSAGRLRHPVWRGWRPDKRPGTARREA
jgi:bifunctional non-homologous end joining protein LigD